MGLSPDALVSQVVIESRWIFPSVLLALVASGMRLRQARSRDPARIAGAMCLFTGLFIAGSATGHLVAVTLKLAWGTLEGSVGGLYAIGVVLAIPSVLLVAHGWRLTQGKGDPGRKVVVLNGLMITALVVTGPRNLPLALPALLTVAYARHRRPAVGRAILVSACVVGALLLAGSFLFFMSGGSFEDFAGLDAP